MNLCKKAWRTNTSNLGFVLLLFAVVACSCPKLDELMKKSESPSPTSTPGRSSTPSTTVKKGEYTLTMEKYNELKIGMPRADVEDTLGGKGAEVSSSTGGGVRFTVNKWEGDDFNSIILTFKNDKLMTKSQVGLDK